MGKFNKTPNINPPEIITFLITYVVRATGKKVQYEYRAPRKLYSNSQAYVERIKRENKFPNGPRGNPRSIPLNNVSMWSITEIK